MLVLQGNPGHPMLKEASAVLDQTGLSYMTKRPVGDGDSGGDIRVNWGAASVSNFSRQELVQFLWDHGATFEDS